MRGNAFLTLVKGEGAVFVLTRQLLGYVYAGDNLVVHRSGGVASGEWLHIALSVAGSRGGTWSSAGPIVYVNGEKAADGSIVRRRAAIMPNCANGFRFVHRSSEL